MNQALIIGTSDPMMPALAKEAAQITVCVCTYKRPHLLRRLLKELIRQDTGGLFRYSIVVADNDEAKSAEATVAETRTLSNVRITYCVEPRRSIALARNKVVANAEGEYVAFIDDDEFPEPEWLLKLFRTCNEHKVDGVLGPVKRHFDETPPAWFRNSSIYDRAVYPTGQKVAWEDARTGNVLLRRRIIASEAAPFRQEFRAGRTRISSGERPKRDVSLSGLQTLLSLRRFLPRAGNAATFCARPLFKERPPPCSRTVARSIL